MSIRATTLGELKKTGYQPKDIKTEMRDNLVKALSSGIDVFEGIFGFEDTVIPDIQRAILSRHNILLLGLRGQAKTRIARMMIRLLDEFIPVIAGSELNDDPMQPLSFYGKKQILELGDNTPISWLHRDERYIEKLATPDVSVADLIGDVDPIKAASLKLSYGHEEVIHFGLIPRSHRCIFVINEIPDLQARIQVSLFNILQEGDIQIRGFKTRLPLDIAFVFTANPEDYTNRGSIITPLKDRIESQILTHYPDDLAVARKITMQEARIPKVQKDKITIPDFMLNILERISFTARNSEYVDEKSGVSARLAISGLENLYSSAERRMLLNNENNTVLRIADFWGVVPAITGKVELVYEGEVEGQRGVAMRLIGQAIRDEFLTLFPHPEKIRKGKDSDPYAALRAYFNDDHIVTLPADASEQVFNKLLSEIPGIDRPATQVKIEKSETPNYRELILHALADFNIISRELGKKDFKFSDPLTNLLDSEDDE